MKIFKRIPIVIGMALMLFAFGACTEESGDYIYSIYPDGGSMTYQLYGESTVLAEVEKVAQKYDVGTATYMLSGKKKDCNKKIIAAVDAGMDAVESKSSYGTVVVLSGVTILVQGTSNEIVYSRTFK